MTTSIQHRLLAALLASAFLCLAADDLPPLPPTPKKPVTDDYQGVQVVDDYRWLEPSADPEVRKWSDQQNLRTRAYLDRLAGRAAIVERLPQLNGSSSIRFSALSSRAGVLFALKSQPPKPHPYLVVLTSPDDPASARTIVDPNALDPTASTTINRIVIGRCEDGIERIDSSDDDIDGGRVGESAASSLAADGPCTIVAAEAASVSFPEFYDTLQRIAE